jgi:hypothetical protein
VRRDGCFKIGHAVGFGQPLHVTLSQLQSLHREAIVRNFVHSSKCQLFQADRGHHFSLACRGNIPTVLSVRRCRTLHARTFTHTNAIHARGPFRLKRYLTSAVMTLTVVETYLCPQILEEAVVRAAAPCVQNLSSLAVSWTRSNHLRR